jgi:hypothetical protein
MGPNFFIAIGSILLLVLVLIARWVCVLLGWEVGVGITSGVEYPADFDSGEEMSILEEHKELEKQMKERHRQELNALEAELKAKQKKCKHPEWERHEEMFYALGETAPGEMCLECGLKRRVR